MKCSNCGNQVPDDAVFCDRCGEKISFDGDNLNVTDNHNSISLFCEKCGAEIEEGMEFCGECGTAVTLQNSNYIYCGNCGTKNPDYMQLCQNCGKELYEPKNSESLKEEHSKKKYVVVILVLIGLILGMAAGMFSYINKSNSNQNVDNKPDEKKTTLSKPSEQSQNSSDATTEDFPQEDIDIARQMDTYYAVNCKVAISLRESPDPMAKVLREIPLGAPVSYVEPAENGFAKVIYNGVTGYSLQSYLSEVPPDIKENDNSNSSVSTDNVKEEQPVDDIQTMNEATIGAISNPLYNTFVDSKYGITCSYPDHFVEMDNDDPFVRQAYIAPDMSATLNICGTNNKANLSVQTVQDNFKSSYPGSVDYENKGKDWCVCRTYDGAKYHYGYFKLKGGKIRGFEMHFDESDFTIYDEYINDIYESLNFN